MNYIKLPNVCALFSLKIILCPYECVDCVMKNACDLVTAITDNIERYEYELY